jgi:hypothetical protein
MYRSVLDGILHSPTLLPHYMILKLGGGNPYLKFGNMDRYDFQYFRPDKYDRKHTEAIIWSHLLEEGRLVLPIRHIRMIYRDEDNNISHEEFAMSDCIDHGCRATLDTKSYYIYGPENQLGVRELI